MICNYDGECVLTKLNYLLYAIYDTLHALHYIEWLVLSWIICTYNVEYVLTTFALLLNDLNGSMKLPPAQHNSGKSPEGLLKVLTSGTLRGPIQKFIVYDLLVKFYFRSNSPRAKHLLLSFSGKKIFKCSKWGCPRDVYGFQLREVLGTK